AAALAVTVDTALHVRGAAFDREQRVCDRNIGVVMAMDSEHAVETGADLSDDFDDARGQRSPVGVTQAEHIGARGLGSFERSKREAWIGGISIEEVLWVVNDLAAVALQVRDGVRDKPYVFLFRNTECAPDVKIPSFSEDGNDGRAFAEELRAI